MNRTSSQKPGDELLANFRQQFPEVAAATSSSTTDPASTVTAEHTDAAGIAQERYVQQNRDPPPTNPPSSIFPGQRAFGCLELAMRAPSSPHSGGETTWSRGGGASTSPLPTGRMVDIRHIKLSPKFILYSNEHQNSQNPQPTPRGLSRPGSHSAGVE